MIKNQAPVAPLSMRIPWNGVNGEDQEIKTFAYLGVCGEAMVQAGGKAPCAIRLHAVDAYDLAGHRDFDASFGVGQILGRILGMAVILDPHGIASQAELIICPGCQDEFPACDYAEVAA